MSCGGRCSIKSVPVYLNVYDLTSMNGCAYWFGVGANHSGVQVHGVEFAFGWHKHATTGIDEGEPKRREGCIFRKQIRIGLTHMSLTEVRGLMKELGQDYKGNSYHLIKRNCNHFCKDACFGLTGSAIPSWINRLARLGKLFNCLIPACLCAPKVGAVNGKKVPGVEASRNSYVRHTGGSTNFVIHNKKMRDETGIHSKEIELFKRAHQLHKFRCMSCDARAKNVPSNYHDIVKENNTSEVEISDDGIVTYATYGNPPFPARAFDDQAWVNATNRVHKLHKGTCESRDARAIKVHSKYHDIVKEKNTSEVDISDDGIATYATYVNPPFPTSPAFDAQAWENATERVHKVHKGTCESRDARAINVHSKYHDIVKEKNTSEVEISDDGIATYATYVNSPLPASLAFDAQARVNATERLQELHTGTYELGDARAKNVHSKYHDIVKENNTSEVDISGIVTNVNPAFPTPPAFDDQAWVNATQRVHKLHKGTCDSCDARVKNVHSKYHDIVKEKNTYEVEKSDDRIATYVNPPFPAPRAFDAQARVNATERVHELHTGTCDSCDARAKNGHSKYHDIVKEKNKSEVEISDDGIATYVNPTFQAWVNATGDLPKTVNGFGLTEEAEYINKQVKQSSTKKPISYASTSTVFHQKAEIAELKRENAILKSSVKQMLKLLTMQQDNMLSNEQLFESST